MLKKIIVSFALVLAVTATAQASWYMELTGVDGTLTAGEYYTMDINFVTDDDTLNLNDWYLTVDYDETLVSYVAYMAQEYDDGGLPFPTTIWECPLPETDTGDLVYNLLGAEALGQANEFFPGAGTTFMGTVYFMAETSGTYTDIGLWADGPVSDLVTVNNQEENSIMYPDGFTQTKVGNTWRIEPTTSPVPVPAAVWLLGSGLIGLIGIRRRNS